MSTERSYGCVKERSHSASLCSPLSTAVHADSPSVASLSCAFAEVSRVAGGGGGEDACVGRGLSRQSNSRRRVEQGAWRKGCGDAGRSKPRAEVVLRHAFTRA
eukprot:1091300-Rhodomonas_salina.2